jgi:putative ABC transport system permease protein
MDELELVKLAILALRTNFVRTILTMLGVIIGIASVIIIMSLGQGATQSIVGEISSFGANVITVQAGRFVRGPGGSGGTIDTLVVDDAKKIAQLPNVTAVSGTVSTSKKIVYDGATISQSITGVEANYESIRSLTLTQGTFFTEGQVLGRAKVLVLGDEKVEDLFGEDAQVVGESVRVDGKNFKIIGVLADSSAAYVPITTAQTVLLSQSYLNGIDVAVTSSELVNSMSDEIESQLLVLHDIADAKNADFSIRSSQEIISSVSSVTGTLTAMLSGIAAISLVVGGIGIMNIMLVTVTERTREIGLLKALGAKKKDILNQFLIEAIVVTMLGGLVGVVLGGVVTYIATLFLNIPFVISYQSIGLALGVSIGVGVVFGWYPAKKAANLQPIDALRYE